MKYPLWIGMTALVLACGGCFTPSADKAPPTVRALTPPPPPVTVEMINDANRNQTAQALSDELDREMQGRALTPAKK